MRLERAYSKDKILELYLNEIYLGLGAYGIAAASLVYFDKSVNELTVAEAAYPRRVAESAGHAESGAQPRPRGRAAQLRGRSSAGKWLDQAGRRRHRAQGSVGRHQPKQRARTLSPASISPKRSAATCFERYGEKKLYEGGLSVRTTLDPKLQVMARKTMAAGLVNFDEAQGWRGATSKLDISGDWGVKLADVKSLNDISPWRMAVVLETSDQSARIGFQPGRELGGACPQGPADRHHHAGRREVGKADGGTGEGQDADGRIAGIVARRHHLRRPADRQGRLAGRRPVPAAPVAGSIRRHGGDGSAWTGRVLAMVGGFSFDQSQFNRATQAYRQPGSTIKPIVYSSAIDNGYTPSPSMVDGPIEIDQGQGGGVWRPDNFSVGKYQGPTTLRNALRLSLNTVTVRLAQDIGMPLIGEYAKRFGVYDELPNYLSYALGAGETTVMRMVTAYSMFANGGRRVKPTLIDRIQDRYGHTIFKHDARECRGCDAPEGWKNQPEPQLVDHREQVLDVLTAYQITSMMEGVVQGGTAIALQRSRQADRRQDRHHQ